MKFSFSVLYTMFIFSLVVKCSRKKGVDKSIDTNSKDDYTVVCSQHFNESGLLESEKKNSLRYFQITLHKLGKLLNKCYNIESIDVSCYFRVKTSILRLAEDVKISRLSEDEKWIIQLQMSGITTYKFPDLEKDAETKCSLAQHHTPSCIHFSFEIYAREVELFEIQTEDFLKNALNFDYLSKEKKDVFFVNFRKSKSQFQRLLTVSTKRWENKPGFRKVEQVFIIIKYAHRKVASILKFKGIKVWIDTWTEEYGGMS